MRKTSTLYM